MGLVSQTHSTEAFVPVLAQKWRVLRVSAAVAQEEAAVEAAAPVTEEVEEKAAEEVSGGGEGESGGGATNTKLYFGNLPYHCDSAQLAGIIQAYGEPELVEVCAIISPSVPRSSYSCSAIYASLCIYYLISIAECSDLFGRTLTNLAGR